MRCGPDADFVASLSRVPVNDVTKNFANQKVVPDGVGNLGQHVTPVALPVAISRFDHSPQHSVRRIMGGAVWTSSPPPWQQLDLLHLLPLVISQASPVLLRLPANPFHPTSAPHPTLRKFQPESTQPFSKKRVRISNYLTCIRFCFDFVFLIFIQRFLKDLCRYSRGKTISAAAAAPPFDILPTYVSADICLRGTMLVVTMVTAILSKAQVKVRHPGRHARFPRYQRSMHLGCI